MLHSNGGRWASYAMLLWTWLPVSARYRRGYPVGALNLADHYR